MAPQLLLCYSGLVSLAQLARSKIWPTPCCGTAALQGSTTAAWRDEGCQGGGPRSVAMAVMVAAWAAPLLELEGSCCLGSTMTGDWRHGRSRAYALLFRTQGETLVPGSWNRRCRCSCVAVLLEGIVLQWSWFVGSVVACCGGPGSVSRGLLFGDDGGIE